jgi:(4S)-4-hydroxy-5-phosphonooxypentane-2,3-dione isomerase
MFVQVVTIEILPGSREKFLEAMRANRAGSRAEPGNVRFDVLGDPEDPNRFEIYEVFRDADALEAHRASAHYLACRSIIDPIIVTGSKRYLEAVMVEDRSS